MNRRASRPRRRGLTLLEVMLSLAILGGAMAAVGELVRVGARSAMEARDLAAAQTICETKMAELAAGLLPVETMGPLAAETYDVSDQWLYSVEVQPIDQQGLLAVRVTVEKSATPEAQPVQFSLLRWMIDPNLLMELEAEEAAEGGGAAEQTSGGAAAGASAAGAAGANTGANAGAGR